MQSVTLKEILEILTYLSTILGIPLAIYLFYQEKKKERIDREWGTYNALDDKYVEFLRLCLENIDLDVFDIRMKSRNKMTNEQKRRELIIFTILISIFERAFLMYRDQSSKIKKTQLLGWNDYILDWTKRDNFRKAWTVLGDQFDVDFINYMNKIFEFGSENIDRKLKIN